jgi:hypothetical protein
VKRLRHGRDRPRHAFLHQALCCGNVFTQRLAQRRQESEARLESNRVVQRLSRHLARQESRDEVRDLRLQRSHRDSADRGSALGILAHGIKQVRQSLRQPALLGNDQFQRGGCVLQRLWVQVARARLYLTLTGRRPPFQKSFQWLVERRNQQRRDQLQQQEDQGELGVQLVRQLPNAP